MNLKSTQATLPKVWFFDILDLKSGLTTFTGVRLILWYSGLGLKKHLDCLTGLWFYYTLDLDCGLIKWINQADMSLEEYEDFLESSIKQFVMQLNPASLGQIMCDVWKTKC